MRRILSIILFLIISSISVRAQFYILGDDPGGLKWYSVETPHYKIIYPAGLDSLSREYGRQLERFWRPVGMSSGYMPGEMYRAKTPVILHAHNAVSNGSVTWAPRRMDFYTTPDAYDAAPLPWVNTLAVHESRHLSQMQFGYGGLLRPLNWLLGEMAPGAMSAVFPNQHLLEGDAVVAETALTEHGRGRNGDFLNYYAFAFGQGDWRNWYSWRYGSFRRPAPDHYALGYLTIAGARVFYDDPLFMKEYFGRVTRNPFRLFNLQRQMKEASGLRFNDAFRDIAHRQLEIWRANDAFRAPFVETDILTAEPSWWTEYRDVAAAGDGRLVAVRSGLREPSWLVEIGKDGAERRLRPFAAAGGGVTAGGERIYWSEAVPDPRWGLKKTSRIRYMAYGDAKVHDLTKEGRFFNPALSPGGEFLSVTDYPVEGGSALVVLRAGDGAEVRRFRAPDSLQVVESAWAGDVVYVTGVSERGTGVYRIVDGRYEELLGPQSYTVSGLESEGKNLFFSCDRTGVNEVYVLIVDESALWRRKDSVVHQLTSTKYGAKDAALQDGELYFTSLSPEGRLVHRMPAPPLGARKNYRQVAEYYLAEKLTEQEKALGAWPEDSVEVEFSEPKRYRKLPHVPNVHSWAPVYFSSDDIADASFEGLYDKAALGATVLYQNELGTAYGSVGYSYRPGADRRHGAHLDFTYSGLYPVFKASVNMDHRNAVQYHRVRQESGALSATGAAAYRLGVPAVNASLQVYVPLNFSSGGWSRGVIPQMTWHVSNDSYDKTITRLEYAPGFDGFSLPQFVGAEPGENVVMQTLSASARAYVMREKAKSQAYPGLGVSVEAGYVARLAMTDVYSAVAYAYAYGYLPGVVPQQGLRLSALYQHLFSGTGIMGENRVDARPRGLVSQPLANYLANNVPDQLRITADYAVPFSLGDISFLSPLLYIRNFEFTPFVDVLAMSGRNGRQSLCTAGFDFSVKCGNFLWLPYDTEIGFTVGYNGGSSFEAISGMGYNLGRGYVGGIFSVSL